MKDYIWDKRGSVKAVVVDAFRQTIKVTGSMAELFSDQYNLVSVKLTGLDTSRVTNMTSMFRDTHCLTSLDLSTFDTSQVTGMYQIFFGANSLTSLDVSSFDTSKVENMQSMFFGTAALKELTLSNKMTIGNTALPDVQVTGPYTGKWQNVGSGSVTAPKGSNVWTSAEFMTNYSGDKVDTYVWQPTPQGGGDVTVHYHDEAGQEVHADVVLSGNIGETYSSEEKNIDGYTFKEVQGSATGQFTDSPQEVTYVYTQNPVAGGDVTVHYHDEAGQELHADVVLSGNVGETYSSEEKTFDGYTFKEVQGSASGQFTDRAQEVTYIYTRNAVTFNQYKNSYWRDYGFVLEGQSGSTDMDLSTKDKVTHQVELVDGSNTVVKTWNGVATNWYGDQSQYNGYQAILTTTDLGALSSGTYTFRVRTTEKSSGIQESGDSFGSFSFIGDMSDTIAGLDKGTAFNNSVSFAKDGSKNMTLTVASEDAVFNKLSHYQASGNEIIDGWIATDFDFKQGHTKELVIEDGGSEVHRQNAPTWDITKTFGVAVKDEWKKSGFQANIPSEHMGKKAYIVVTDDADQEVAKVAIN